MQGGLPTHGKAVELSSVVAEDLEALHVGRFTGNVDGSLPVGPAVDGGFVVEEDRQALQVSIHDSQVKSSGPGDF